MKKRRRYGERALHDVRSFAGTRYALAEKLSSYREAQLAAAEYRADADEKGRGWCCRVIPVEKKNGGFYEIWVGPRTRRAIRTLPGERIRRNKTATRLRLQVA